jgi:hypothetical protein
MQIGVADSGEGKAIRMAISAQAMAGSAALGTRRVRPAALDTVCFNDRKRR